MHWLIRFFHRNQKIVLFMIFINFKSYTQNLTLVFNFL